MAALPRADLAWASLEFSAWHYSNNAKAYRQHYTHNTEHCFPRIFRLCQGTGSFTGKIIPTSSVTKNVSQIMTRHCSMSVAAASDWDSKFKLDQYSIHEVQFWQNNINKLNSLS